jgi:hypothetical protein
MVYRSNDHPFIHDLFHALSYLRIHSCFGNHRPIPIHTYGYGYNGNHNTNNNNPQQLIPPFEWLHIDARNARTALQNLAGVASLAAERGWRQRCVLSLDLARLPQDADAVSAPIYISRINLPLISVLTSFTIFLRSFSHMRTSFSCHHPPQRL